MGQAQLVTAKQRSIGEPNPVDNEIMKSVYPNGILSHSPVGCALECVDKNWAVSPRNLNSSHFQVSP